MEIFKITGKRLVFLGVVCTLIGALLLGYHLMVYDLIFKGKFPTMESTQIAVGSLLMTIGPWIIKARNMVKRAVQ